MLTSKEIKENMRRYLDYWRDPDVFSINEKALCLRMCSEEEIKQRSEVEISSVNPFEKDENGKNFELLAIKAY